MKVVLKKRPAPPPPEPRSARDYRKTATSRPTVADDTAWIPWAIVAVLVVLVVGIAAGCGVAQKRRADALARARIRMAPQRAAAPTRRGEVPGGILGEFDMNAWCQENDKSNAELQARRARMRGGAPRQPPAQP
jgi:hypothetical protein